MNDGILLLFMASSSTFLFAKTTFMPRTLTNNPFHAATAMKKGLHMELSSVAAVDGMDLFGSDGGSCSKSNKDD